MKTTLSPEQVATLHTRAATLPMQRFVDPHEIARLRRILMQRGERWVASVLLRPLTRRARIDARMPWLNDIEVQIILLAEQEEFNQLVKDAQAHG